MIKQFIISSITIVIFISVFFIVQYIKNDKSIKKRQEYFRELHRDLKVGDKVSFANGFYGTIKKINNKEETVDIQLREGVMTISRYLIMEVLN